jgi:predicted secreted hydrolase
MTFAKAWRHPALMRQGSAEDWFASLGSLMVCSLLLSALPAAGQSREPQNDLTTADGFALPQPGKVFAFPRDHGSHPEFKIEWWYVTGHLWTESRRRFGFQVTFFRSAGPRDISDAVGTPAFGSRNLYLAHAALLDVKAGRFLHQERLNREGWDAGAATNGLAIRNGNWSLRSLEGLSMRLHLSASVHAEGQIDLQLEPAKPLVTFGKDGISRKGAHPTAASHYLTFTRLAAEGRVALDGVEHRVRGQAWMDHEFSSSQLDVDQVGWDWASIQLNDGREIMCYVMRRRDGRPDPHSTMAWIDEAGQVTHRSVGAFRWEPLSHWRSPRTGAEYPSATRLVATDPESGDSMEMHIQPLARDQELRGAIGEAPYWEGACRVMDLAGREIGSAYMELTGYAGDLHSRLR